MKKLILLILLIPTLCLAGPGEPNPNWTKEDNDNFKIVMMSDFVICRSPKAIINITTTMKCVNGPEAKIDLFNLYQNKFHLIQVIKSEKEYIYYLEKK
jgi:hypothetical protein